MKPKWWTMARQMRADGASQKTIARAFSKSIVQVRRACRGVACPVDHQSVRASEGQRTAWSNPKQREQRIAAMRAGHAARYR